MRRLTHELSQRPKASSATSRGYRDEAPREGNLSHGQEQSTRRSDNFGRGSGHRSDRRRNGSRVQFRPHPGDGISTCHRCGETGHWSRECPHPDVAKTPAEDSKPVTDFGLGKLNKLGEGLGEEEVYIRTIVNGKPLMALLDTGCQISVIGAGMLPDFKNGID